MLEPTEIFPGYLQTLNKMLEKIAAQILGPNPSSEEISMIRLERCDLSPEGLRIFFGEVFLGRIMVNYTAKWNGNVWDTQIPAGITFMPEDDFTITTKRKP